MMRSRYKRCGKAGHAQRNRLAYYNYIIMWVNSIPGTAKCCINNMHNSVIESQQLNKLMHNKFKYEITAYT